MATDLYNKISIPAVPVSKVPTPKAYKGFSTINSASENFALYDFELIKQDLMNYFHIRKGERLMNPNWGTIIWDSLFEPMTETLKEQIVADVNDIINSDPRLVAKHVVVTTYESGIQIECTLTYLPYNITQSMQLKFDQDNGIANNKIGL
jgi:phage baseplate assembly protein W